MTFLTQVVLLLGVAGIALSQDSKETVEVAAGSLPLTPSLLWEMGLTTPRCGGAFDANLALDAGFTYLEAGDRKSAEKCLGQARGQGNFWTHNKLQKNKSNSWYFLGDALRGLGKLAEALAAYKQALALLDRDRGDIARTNFGLGETYQAMGDFAAALPRYRTAIENLDYQEKLHENYHYFARAAMAAQKLGLGDEEKKLSQQAEYFSNAFRSFYGFMRPGQVEQGYRNLTKYYRVTGRPDLSKDILAGYPKLSDIVQSREEKLNYLSGQVGYAASRPSMMSMILQSTSEAIAENRGVSPGAAPRTQTIGLPSSSTAGAGLSCSDWSPRLQRLLDAETDPVFRKDLERQKSGADPVVNLVARSGGLAEAKRLNRLQVEDYQRQVREQGTETALGHTEVRQRLLQAVQYNEAVGELLSQCR